MAFANEQWSIDDEEASSVVVQLQFEPDSWDDFDFGKLRSLTDF